MLFQEYKNKYLWLVFFTFLFVIPFISSFNFENSNYGLIDKSTLTTTINYSLQNVNNSLYWQGHTGTDGSWLTGIFDTTKVNKSGDTVTGDFIIDGAFLTIANVPNTIAIDLSSTTLTGGSEYLLYKDANMYLSADGTFRLGNELKFSSGGSASDVAVYSGQGDSGMYFPDTDVIAFASDGTKKLQIDTSSVDVETELIVNQAITSNRSNYAKLNLKIPTSTWILENEDNIFKIGNATNKFFYINSAGNVGIGIPTPQDLLHISGISPVIRFEDSGATNLIQVASTLEFWNSTTRAGWFGFGSSSNTDFSFDNEAGGQFKFLDEVGIDGDLGVGVTTAQAGFRADIRGDVAGGPIYQFSADKTTTADWKWTAIRGNGLRLTESGVTDNNILFHEGGDVSIQHGDLKLYEDLNVSGLIYGNGSQLTDLPSSGGMDYTNLVLTNKTNHLIPGTQASPNFNVTSPGTGDLVLTTSDDIFVDLYTPNTWGSQFIVRSGASELFEVWGGGQVGIPKNSGTFYFDIDEDRDSFITVGSTDVFTWRHNNSNLFSSTGGFNLAAEQPFQVATNTNTAYNYAFKSNNYYAGTTSKTFYNALELVNRWASTGTITTQKGIDIYFLRDAGKGAATNSYGIYSQPMDGLGTNQYGIYLSNVQNGTSINYALYTNNGLVRFGDNVTSTGYIHAVDFLTSSSYYKGDDALDKLKQITYEPTLSDKSFVEISHTKLEELDMGGTKVVSEPIIGLMNKSVCYMSENKTTLESIEICEIKQVEEVVGYQNVTRTFQSVDKTLALLITAVKQLEQENEALNLTIQSQQSDITFMKSELCKQNNKYPWCVGPSL